MSFDFLRFEHDSLVASNGSMSISGELMTTEFEVLLFYFYKKKAFFIKQLLFRNESASNRSVIIMWEFYYNLVVKNVRN